MDLAVQEAWVSLSNAFCQEPCPGVSDEQLEEEEMIRG